MTREEKSQVIQDLTVKLTRTNTIYFEDMSRLYAFTQSNFRLACFEANDHLADVQNTVLS